MAIQHVGGTLPTESADGCRWIRKWGFTALLAAAAVHAISVAVWPRAYWSMIDLEVYRDGALAMLRGAPLYDGGVTAGLAFVYPPFAAILFTPLTLFPMPVVRALWTAMNAVLLAAVIAWSWRRLSASAARTPFLPTVALFTGAFFLLDAVRVTTYLGQINLVLMALVAGDLLRGRRWQGVGIGIAAAVKLTPLVFVVYLLATRRFRAAGVAVGVFAGTVAVSFAVLPGQAGRFWLDGAFGEVSRINPVSSGGNHSLRGMLARLLGEGAGATALWALCAGAALVAGLALARRAHARGDEVLGMALCGLTGAAISPFSWTHHWVWLVPFLLCCAHRAVTAGRRGLGVLALLLGASAVAWPTGFPDPASGLIPPSGLASLDGRLGTVGGFVAGNVYVVTFAVVLAASAAMLRRDRLTTPRA